MGLISPGNTKLGALPSFSIATIACDLIPGPDEQGCKKHCYAKRHIEIYPSARKSYLKNFELSKLPGFAAMMDATIKSDAKLQKIGLMRIHVAGDFYSQDYLDKWFSIALMNSNIMFYGYTKAYNLNWSNKPDNMLMKLSDDKGIWTAHYNKFDGVARVVDPGALPLARNEVICANQMYGQTCAQCKMCMNKNPQVRKLTIKFRRH